MSPKISVDHRTSDEFLRGSDHDVSASPVGGLDVPTSDDVARGKRVRRRASPSWVRVTARHSTSDGWPMYFCTQGAHGAVGHCSALFGLWVVSSSILAVRLIFGIWRPTQACQDGIQAMPCTDGNPTESTSMWAAASKQAREKAGERSRITKKQVARCSKTRKVGLSLDSDAAGDGKIKSRFFFPSQKLENKEVEKEAEPRTIAPKNQKYRCHLPCCRGAKKGKSRISIGSLYQVPRRLILFHEFDFPSSSRKRSISRRPTAKKKASPISDNRPTLPPAPIPPPFTGHPWPPLPPPPSPLLSRTSVSACSDTTQAPPFPFLTVGLPPFVESKTTAFHVSSFPFASSSLVPPPREKQYSASFLRTLERPTVLRTTAS